MSYFRKVIAAVGDLDFTGDPVDDFAHRALAAIYASRADVSSEHSAPPAGPAKGAAGLLPSPALGESGHRSLARRLELWCAPAPERQYLALLRSGLWDLLANDYAATYLDASFLAAISARR